MSTQSAIGFEWSVKLIGDAQFYVGIASKLTPGKLIREIDENAIFYSNNTSPAVIQIGNDVIHSNLTEQKTGDVIRFKFQPHIKKLVIELVRIFFDAPNEAPNRKFRTNVTKLICVTTFIIFLLSNPIVDQQKKLIWSNKIFIKPNASPGFESFADILSIHCHE